MNPLSTPGLRAEERLLEDKKERDFASGQGYRGSGKEQEIAGSSSYYDGVRTSVKGYQEIDWRPTSSLKAPRPMSVFQERPGARTMEAEGLLTEVPHPISREHPVK